LTIIGVDVMNLIIYSFNLSHLFCLLICFFINLFHLTEIDVDVFYVRF
jgi:hypothetical protein